jgi:hypothetical protein
MYAQIYACFMTLLLSSHMYVLIFKLVHLWPLYVLLLAYTPNLLIIELSSCFRINYVLIWPDMATPLPDISGQIFWKSLSQISHVRPMAWIYPGNWTCLAFRPDISGSRVSRVYKGFLSSSTETLQFLGDLPPLTLGIFNPSRVSSLVNLLQWLLSYALWYL